MSVSSVVQLFFAGILLASLLKKRSAKRVDLEKIESQLRDGCKFYLWGLFPPECFKDERYLPVKAWVENEVEVALTKSPGFWICKTQRLPLLGYLVPFYFLQCTGIEKVDSAHCDNLCQDFEKIRKAASKMVLKIKVSTLLHPFRR